MANQRPKVTPAVGVGVTITVGSDRYPATIQRVSDNLKRIWITEPDNPQEQEYTLRKDGRYHLKGTEINSGCYYLYIGKAEYYRDPSF